MRQPRAIAIDELVEHEFAVDERFLVFRDLPSDGLKELCLHLAERFGRPAARVSGGVGGLRPAIEFTARIVGPPWTIK